MKPSPLVDLGHDTTRMKDPRDVCRQHETVKVLLERFYAHQDDKRFELQVLADEVGMGKTFVALAVAFAILEARRAKAPELGRCARKILVLVPSNSALFQKWGGEVGEFVKRCIPAAQRREAIRHFQGRAVANLDELIEALSRRGGAQVIIAKPSALRGKLQHFDARAQLTLHTLFKHWSVGFKKDLRKRLLAGAPPGWPTTEEDLKAACRSKALPFDAIEALEALRRYVARPEASETVAALRQTALTAASEHFIDKRRKHLEGLRSELLRLYKHAMLRERVSRALPLVIVDEAHNWKNHKNGYQEFVKFIAPRTQRLLLMTATPFQLRPDEMLKMLEAGDALKLSKERCERMRSTREQHLRVALAGSERASQALSHEWARLNPSTTQAALDALWQRPRVRTALDELDSIADRPGALGPGEIDAAVERGVDHAPANLQAFLRHALILYAYNRDLCHELGEWMIRHRKTNDHRLVRVGHELHGDEQQLAAQPGHHALHAAPGLDVHGEAELPHYLLMRATSALRHDNGKKPSRASLGCNLTGCYSTLFESCDGRSLKGAIQSGPAGVYIELLKDLVGNKEADALHPKMRGVVQQVVEHWAAGDKSLIFCFRKNTAQRLHELIGEAIDERLKARQLVCLGGEHELQRLRERMQGRERDLTPIVLDKVLWSLHWAPLEGEPVIHTDSFNIQASDYREIARLSLKFGLDLRADRLDHVFLNRAAECAQAQRLRADCKRGSLTRNLLDAMADESWVHFPYGITPTTDEDGEQVIDEKGVHHVYQQSGEPSPTEVDALKEYLLAQDGKAQREGRIGPVRNAFDGPNLWLGAEPRTEVIAGHDKPADVEQDLRDQRQFHIHLRSLTWKNHELDWSSRARAMQAVRRTALRPSMLSRILPSAGHTGTTLSAKALVQQFTEPLGGKGESLLRRLGVFLEDLASASGDITDSKTARGALFDASRIRPKNGVALVDGRTDSEQRSRYFNGFNTPLEPEVLICTSVGQEGIDLHRQCRHVFHYDLTWNPATLEQRTGRVDRIGSLAQRERQLEQRSLVGGVTNHSDGNGSNAPNTIPHSVHYLDISVPYLAGTYDERMFEELRLRSQVFEVLTGGDLAPDSTDGKQSDDDANDEDEGNEKADGLVVLPDAVVESLRVDLRVWKS